MWECGFLMLKRRPLSWTQTMHGLWRGIGSGLCGVFVLVFIPAIRKFFHPRDTTLVFGELHSACLGQLIFSVGTYDWVIFLFKYFFEIQNLAYIFIYIFMDYKFLNLIHAIFSCSCTHGRRCDNDVFQVHDITNC